MADMAGRDGKQPDGSAKTREAKLVTVWTAESRDDQGKPMRDPGSITYSAAIESISAGDTNPERSAFTERCCAKRLGDGSAWIVPNASANSLRVGSGVSLM